MAASPPNQSFYSPRRASVLPRRTVLPRRQTVMPSNPGSIPPSPAAIPPSSAAISPNPAAIPPSPAPIPLSSAPEKNNLTPNPKKRKFEHLNDQILFVRCGLGSAQELIGVHKSLLTEDSKFFCSVVKPVWNKSGEAQPTVDLTDEDPEIVKMYINFRYIREVDFKDESTEGDVLNDHRSYRNLFKAYVFGEKILSGEFQNAVIRAIIHHQRTSKSFPYPGLFPIVYEGTPAGSPLRRLVVDFWAKRADKDWSHENLAQNTCLEFMIEVISALVEQRDPVKWNNFDSWTKSERDFFKKSE